MCQTPRPSKTYTTDSLVGTWACNGAHRWRCYSSGKDVYRHLYPHVPKKYKPPQGWVMCGVPGSNQLFSFRGVEAQISRAFPVRLQAKFIRCKCLRCRSGHEALCQSKNKFGDWIHGELKLRKVKKRTRTDRNCALSIMILTVIICNGSRLTVGYRKFQI